MGKGSAGKLGPAVRAEIVEARGVALAAARSFFDRLILRQAQNERRLGLVLAFLMGAEQAGLVLVLAFSARIPVAVLEAVPANLAPRSR